MANIENIKGRLNIEVYRHFGDTDGNIGVNRMSYGYLSKDPVDIDPVELLNAWFKTQKNTTNDINNFDGTSMICFRRDAPVAKNESKTSLAQ